MKFGSLLSSCILALVLIPNAAFAGDWYVAADLGRAHYGDLESQVSTLTSFGHTTQINLSSSPDTSAYRLTGGYQFDKYWGLEAAYLDLGQGEAKTTWLGATCGLSCSTNYFYDLNLKVRAYSLAGTGTLPLNDRWSLFARLGAFHYQVTEDMTATTLFFTGISGSSSTTSFENTASGWKATWGVGVNCTLPAGWAVRLGLDEYRSVGDAATSQSDIRLITLGLLRRF